METTFDYNNFLIWRMAKGVGCAFGLQIIPLLYIFVITTYLDLFHPLMYIYSVATASLSLRNWLSMLPVFLSMVFVGVTVLQELSYTPKKIQSRYQLFKSALNWHNSFKALAYFLLSIFLPLSYLTISGFPLFQPCSAHKELTCLVTQNVYVFTCCVWMGIFYFIRYELFPKPMSFPVITQPKLGQIWFNLLVALWQCLKQAVLPSFYFIIINYIFGGSIMAFIAKVYLARVDLDAIGFFETCNVSVLVHAWITSGLTFFSLKCLRKCLSVYLTDPHQFYLPVLLKTLQSRDTLMQSLALYDLNLISAGRRGHLAEIYALSQLGGTPHSWNTVLKVYETIVHEFLLEAEILSGIKVQPKIEETQIPPRTSPLINARIRRLVEKEKSPVQPVPAPPALDPTKNKFIAKIKELAPVQFLFAPVPEIQLQALLENSQKLVWIVESVSNLTARALTEDKFGVVVNDVPTVVTSLLCLLQHLGGQRKVRQRDRTARMRFSILSAARRGLTKIAVAYDEHLDHLNLPPETVKIMKGYAAMRLH